MNGGGQIGRGVAEALGDSSPRDANSYATDPAVALVPAKQSPNLGDTASGVPEQVDPTDSRGK